MITLLDSFAGRSVVEFVASYYRTDNLMQTYSSMIMPMPHPDHWIVPPEASAFVVRAPIIKRQAGRPRMSRARSAIESSSRRRQICSKCHNSGHNKHTCTAYIPSEGIL